MAFDYRSVQAPSVLDGPNTLPDNGQASAAQALAGAFKSFSNDAYDVAAKAQTIQGQRQGAADGSAGNIDPKSNFTVFGDAYNNSATRSYAIQAEATAEDTAAKLQVDANNDPATFQATYTAARDATIKAAPVQAQAAIADMYNTRLATGMSALATGQAQQIQKNDRVNLAEGISRQTDRVAQLRAAGDPASMDQADEEQVKLNLLIDGARNTNTISQQEQAAMHISSQKAIVTQTVEAQFQRVLQDPHANPVDFIQHFEQQNLLQGDSAVLPPDEIKQIKQNLFSNLRQYNEMQSMDRRNGKTEEQLRLEQGDRDYTAKLFAGTLTNQQLSDAVTSQNLKPETARALSSQMSSGDKDQSDPKTLFDFKTDLLAHTPTDIAANPKLTWADKATLTDEWQKRNSGWEGTQSSKEAKERIDRALGIVPGTLTQTLTPQEKTQRQTAHTDWYTQMSAVDPAAREAQAIPVATAVIAKTIRTTQTAQAQRLQGSLASYQSGKDPTKMNSTELKMYNDDVANYQRRITAAQAEAARQTQ